MHFSLRWKILLLVILTPATLGIAALLTVRRNVNAHVNASSIHESLEHSVAVFESMLRTRSRALVGGAQVIVQDPRFFSLLMLGPTQRDSRFVSTVRGMANDFNQITQTDLFEVIGRRGRVLASVGDVKSTRVARDSLVRLAMRGRMVEGILVESRGHYQVALAPVYADQQVVGVLLLGAEVGPTLAKALREQMRCEVTFLSGGTITGSTLEQPGDLTALMRMVRGLDLGPQARLEELGVQRVNGPREPYLTLVRRIPGSDPSSPQLFVMQRSFDPETTFRKAMERDMTTLAVIALIAALVTGLLFGEHILRPIQRLVRGAQEMERGNYDHPLDVRSDDELGYLGERFEDMRARERETLRSMEQAARIKSEFLTLASHELRTPISVLSGYRDLLAGGQLGPLQPRQQQAVDAMQTFLARLTTVAEDAARFARIKGERLVLAIERSDPEPLVRRAVGAALAAGARRSVQVESAFEGVDGTVDVDAQALEQAVFHLVANGIRFTPDGGRVTVRVWKTPDTLCIEVKDSGVGMPREKLDAVLSHGLLVVPTNHHRSSTGLDFNSAGLGLGLSIVRGIVEAHDGILRGETALGTGSTFTIEVPLRHARETRAAA